MNRARSNSARSTVRSALALLVTLGAVASAHAISTRYFTADTEKQFSAGELEGTAAFSHGVVRPGHSKERIELKDTALAWSVLADGNAVLVGTGNDGKVLRVEGKNVKEYVATKQLVVTALERGAGGAIYAATIPNGKIFRIDGGKLREFVTLKDAAQIWDLLWDAKKSRLVVATGPEGRLLAVSPKGAVSELHDSEAGHIMTLALDTDGSILFGTSEQARVYRLTTKGQARVVGDFPGNEVTHIALAKGRLAVAANAFPEPRVAKKKSDDDKSDGSAPKPKTGRGQIWVIDSDGSSEQVFRHSKAHFTRVGIDDDGVVYAATGKEGLVYRIEPNRFYATWLDLEEEQILDMQMNGGAPLISVGDGAALYRLQSARGKDAHWTSKVWDAGTTARFGEVSWRAKGKIAIQTRSGNTAEPDEGWSEWSHPIFTPGPIRSAPARYLQVRATLQSDDAELLAVRAYYLRSNQRALVRSISAEMKSSDSDDDGVPKRSSTYELDWDVENPDGDSLRYRLRFRHEKDTKWRPLLRDHEILTKSKYLWETSALPDGYYLVEVEVSDELSNPGPKARKAKLISEPILVDNHAPTIESLKLSGTRLTGEARDTVGPIAKLEYAIDGHEWIPFFPEDEIFDTKRERFSVELPQSARGAIVSVRVFDSAGNTRTAETQM